MKKNVVRITESELKRIVNESVNRILNERVNPLEKIQQLIDAANNAYLEAKQNQENDYPLMDKKGNSYGLKGQIRLDGRGYVIIPFIDVSYGWGDYSSTEKIRVLKRVNGQVQIIKGDYFTEGWRDVQKKLKQIIRDAQIGNEYHKNYDASWEDSDSREQLKTNRSNLKNMNKQIGRIANAGMEYLN